MLQFLGVIFSLFVIALGVNEILRLFTQKPKKSVGAIPDKVAQIVEANPLHFWQGNKYNHSGFEVVGESFYQDNIERVIYRKTLLAKLIPDNFNQHDCNAVRIEIDNLIVGHLSRESAIQFRAFLKNNGLNETDITSCMASVIGGHTKNNRQTSYGIVLDF